MCPTCFAHRRWNHTLEIGTIWAEAMWRPTGIGFLVRTVSSTPVRVVSWRPASRRILYASTRKQVIGMAQKNGALTIALAWNSLSLRLRKSKDAPQIRSLLLNKPVSIGNSDTLVNHPNGLHWTGWSCDRPFHLTLEDHLPWRKFSTRSSDSSRFSYLKQRCTTLWQHRQRIDQHRQRIDTVRNAGKEGVTRKCSTFERKLRVSPVRPVTCSRVRLRAWRLSRIRRAMATKLIRFSFFKSCGRTENFKRTRAFAQCWRQSL